MANALRDILGFAGKAADGLLLGGAIHGAQRKNKFADMLEAGNYDEAAQFASRHGAPEYAQQALQRGALAGEQAEAERKRREEADSDADKFIGLAIDAVMQAGPNERPVVYGAFKNLANSRGLMEYIDPQELAAFEQNLGNDAFLRGVAAQYADLDLKDQVDQRQEGQRIGETARSNRVTEGLRGAEVGISRERLGLDREKFGEDRRQFDATQAASGAKAQNEAATKADALAGSLAARGQRVELITSKFDEAIEQVRGGLDGTAGRNAIFAPLPGTQAKNLAATLDTIKANIGFEELQRMRDNSPTGGALGQVTEKEIAFLQAVLGSLDQGQTPDQLRANLIKAKGDIIASWERVRRAYEQDFGVPYEGPGAGLSGGAALGDSQNTDINALLRKYGVQ